MSNQFLYPRPEYPRPEFRRGTFETLDWINLNGPWQFRFDGDRRGVEEQWFSLEQPEWREQIIVPFCWESLAAWGEGDAAGNDNYYATRVFKHPLEVTRENHRSAARYEVGWYRRHFEVPIDGPWQGKRVILHIGAADFFTDCWCNGVHLGRHEGGYTPFEFDLTDVLHEVNGKRQGLVILRVEDPMDNSEQPVGKQWRWYTTTSGIWQTVFLEPRSQSYLENFKVTGDIDRGTIQFEARVINPGSGASLELEIKVPKGATQRESLPLQDGKISRQLKLNTVALWDPNEPNLYDLRIQLRENGKATDTVYSYFGLRKIDFESTTGDGAPAALRLNGVARYLRGALYQSYYPDGVYTASSMEVLKNDIISAKNFGFNFLRVHIKVDDPVLLYWADKLGMLLMADFPNFGEGGDTPTGRARFETMMRKAVDRDYNHPSIFAWCLFNETWGFGGQAELIQHLLAPPPVTGTVASPSQDKTAKPKKPAAGDRPGMVPPQVWVQQMWELAKRLDSTRLVEDMSVCHWDHLEYYLHCDTDINSWHFYLGDYAKAKEHIHKIVASTFVGSSFNYVPGFLHKGQPLINSEYGGVGALDGDRDVSWSFKFLTNEMRRYQQIAAYIYTELHDVEWEYNGFLNYDRTAKEFGYDPRIINESNTLPVDSPPVQHLKPGEELQLEVSSSHFSTRPHNNVTLHWSLAGMDQRGRLHQDLIRGHQRIEFPHRKVALAHRVPLKMPDFPLLATLLLNACDEDGNTIAQNFVHYYVSEGYPPEREELPRGLVLRAFPSTWKQAEWSGGTGDRGKEQVEDCCYGFGHGFFEWELPLKGAELAKARRIKLLCEASSHRTDWPQTDSDIFPTTLEMTLNGVRLYKAVLRNHPHDSRGVLSYWRGGVGGYGYLAHGFAEDEQTIGGIAQAGGETLRLRCAVPADALAQGGLSVYGAECGRYPLSPTVIIEW